MSKAEDKYIEELAKTSKSPGEFLTAVMKEKGIKNTFMTAHLGVNPSFIRGLKCNYTSIGVNICHKLSVILGIDPFLFYRLCADYKMRKFIEKEYGTRESIKETSD